MRKNLPIIISAIISTLLFLSFIGFVIFKKNSENLPSYEQLQKYAPMITTRLYASDGSLITEFSKEKRSFVPIEMIPKHLINAFLAAEDANFYKHSGIDPFAIFRTAVQNVISIVKGDKSVGGASTITQQVVKNLLLSRERTLERKLKEAILAFRLSKIFSKDKILELYLNQIYLGSGSYGVAAAAQVYFNKSVDDLTIEETALLATLPKAPSKLDPRKNIEKAKFRRDWVIGRMIIEGFITDEEGKAAMAKPIVLLQKQEDQTTKADFFADSVKVELTELYGSDDVFENGIVVRTTLNPQLQKIAQRVFQEGIEEYDRKHGYRGAIGKIDPNTNWQESLRALDLKKIYPQNWKKAVVISFAKNLATIGTEDGDLGTIDFTTLKWAKKYIDINKTGPVPKKISDIFTIGDVVFVEKTAKGETYNLQQLPEVNGAMLAMDPHSGRVLAMMGGYVDSPNQFNRATQAMRQPGSTMKTFAYIAALENNMTPATVIIDEPISLNQGIGMPPYQPSNYSGEYYGPTTLRTGLEQSRNITTVRMADQIGLDKVVEVVKRLGVNDKPAQIYSLPLGSTETTMMRLVSAYSTMVNGGKKVIPSMIEKIQDRNGVTIYRRDKRTCDCFTKDLSQKNHVEETQLPIPVLEDERQRVMDPATAYQITYMLQGVVERGTAMRAKSIGKVIAGKTGTTNSSYDSWFVGFSPDLVVGVYVGFDMPKTLGSAETGASVALPVFINFMKDALKDTPSTPFRVPDSIKFVKIDRLTGKSPTPETPKDQIFMEAFKLNEDAEEAKPEEAVSDDAASEDGAEQTKSATPSSEGVY